MSINLPTAEGTPRTQSPRRSPPGRAALWVVALALAVAFGVFGSGEDRVESPSSVEPAVTQLSSGDVVVPDSFVQFTSEVFFPGGGAFTAMGGSNHGHVVVGERSEHGGGFVWTAGPVGDLWTRRDVEVAERAFLGDVVGYLDGFVIGGAIVGPGMGSSVPTLWHGQAESDFTVVDHPFEGPGRIDALRVIEGELYAIGQGSAPFTDTLRSGAARVGRLLEGRIGRWDDITPPGSNVVVTDVIGVDGGIVAVGGDADGAVVWWRPDGNVAWVTVPLDVGRGVITDVVSHPQRGLVASVRTWDSAGIVRSQLMRADSPRAWTPEGNLLRRDVGWIHPVPDGVIGGPIGGPTAKGGLWGHRFGSGWELLDLSALSSAVAFGASDWNWSLLFGQVAGQPVLWSAAPGPYAPDVVAPREAHAWDFVTSLPGNADRVFDTGGHLVALAGILDPGTIWVSADEGPWSGIEVVSGFGLAGVFEQSGRLLMFGETPSAGVVYEIANGGHQVHLLPGLSIRHATLRGPTLVVLGTGPEGPVRVDLVDGEVQDRVQLASLPARIFEFDGLLVGTGHARPMTDWSLSTDFGKTWKTFEVPIFTAGVSSQRLIVVTAEEPRRVLTVDAATLELTEVSVAGDVVLDSDASPGSTLMTWGDGITAHGPSVLRVLDDLSGEMFDVPLGPENGMWGVIIAPIPGPGGYALVSEEGERVIYRWTRAGA
ncbi:MAG: hypothetical protein WEA76_02605 [Acidimicrobiia bacterium]